MKTIYSIIICLFVMQMTNTLNAQQLADFNLVTTKTFSDDYDLAITSTFEKEASTLTWIQESELTNNLQTIVFSVDNVSGTWNETTSTGILVFDLSIQNTSYTFTLTGTSSGIMAEIDLSVSSPNENEYSFEDCTINYQ
ncbi:hypothetical protein [Psychroserpens sp. SPM9]|uniref:hypothetical protein n=1 Tax=Psychroserpens sp. SPM9 TaxID=2975598 RepID=UPI0021A7BBE2|nr:hypothetical protein [Psychroserpens sp. SPM9]MDG5490640.1 hypothetical protein [Psychroserpens sp. SPM9]